MKVFLLPESIRPFVGRGGERRCLEGNTVVEASSPVGRQPSVLTGQRLGAGGFGSKSWVCESS